MTFARQETSRESGAIISLYRFEYGVRDSDIFTYTDFDTPIDFGGATYTPIVIGREDIKATGGLDNTDIKIQVTPNAPVVEYLQTRSPTQEIAIRMFDGHLDDVDTEFRPVYAGRVIGSTRGDIYFEITCESIVTSMRRVGLRRSYQRSCTYALYGPGCDAARRVRAQLLPTVIGGNFVQFPDGWSGDIPTSKFEGGYISWVDDETAARHNRMILRITPGEVRLDGTTEGIEPDTEINVFAGCNHLLEDCRELHENVNNYGGQWKIPLENPVGYVNRFF